MQICRIEHKDSKSGPYNHTWSLDRGLAEITQDNSLPDLYCSYRCQAPFTDSALRYRYCKDENKGKWSFAFSDIDQLLEWFSGGWPKILHEEGFHIVILEMAYAKLTSITGQCQVMYQPAHATVIGTMDLV